MAQLLSLRKLNVETLKAKGGVEGLKKFVANEQTQELCIAVGNLTVGKIEEPNSARK